MLPCSATSGGSASGRQVDQPDAVFIGGHRRLGDGESDGCLTDPPGPTIVTSRSRAKRETSDATVSSRPIIRVTANGRLCGRVAATVGDGVLYNSASRFRCISQYLI